MKNRCLLYILLFGMLFCMKIYSDNVSFKMLCPDNIYEQKITFPELINSISFTGYSSITPYNDDTPTVKEEGENWVLYAIFSYVIPISYFTYTILGREIIYTDVPEDNPLMYVNPVVTSVTFFGSAGFFAGLAIGLILSNDEGFFESFVYSTLIGLLLGLTGMGVGGIYALLEYDTIITNDLFYYGGPSLMLAIPVFDVIRLIMDD